MTDTYTVDRTGWPHGPWDDEPDKIEWRDEATGLPCLIIRNRRGALCGYVGVPEDHPLHGVQYNQPTASLHAAFKMRKGRPIGNSGIIAVLLSAHGDVPTPEGTFECHGSLTYSGACQGQICHAGDDRVWWFGFDCSHYGDLAPGDFYRGGAYRDMDYVLAECESLARQLAAGKAAT